MLTFTEKGADAGIVVKEFNDRTPNILIPKRFREPDAPRLQITWRFDADRWEKELFVLQCVMAEISQFTEVTLFMPYVPNARMDRVPPGRDNAFTLRTFAGLINGMGFARVEVLDPHSDVTPALIDRCVTVCADTHLRDVLNQGGFRNPVGKPEPVFVFPDAGAAKRYTGGLLIPEGSDVVCGEKIRDWETQHITGYRLPNASVLNWRNVVIVDDIIAHGYTLYFLLKAIVKQGPASVTIFATHIEDSFRDGPLYDVLSRNEAFARVFTTDSVVRPRIKQKIISDPCEIWPLRTVKLEIEEARE